MSVEGLMNQTISIYPKTGYSANGRATLGSAVSVRARAQMKAKRVLLPDGSVITTEAVLYVPADTVVDTDYKLAYLGIEYKVITKYAVPDGSGNTNHIRLEVAKWQST